MNIGQRVEIINGVLQGEQATVIPNPESGEHKDGPFVWIKFDNHNARYGKEKGYAILSPQWFEIERLRAI